MSFYTISILTINYNDVSGLERTIKSVQNQSIALKDHIIIDGGSNDGSKELIEKHKSCFSYWISEPDNGVYDAMNKGIEKANGDYLLFLNSGDHFKDDHSLSKLVAVIDETDPVELIYGNIEVVADRTWIKKYPAILHLDYFIKDSLPHPATLIRKDCFNNQLYDTSLDIVADWKFFLLGIGKQSLKYRYVDEVISVFYYDGISSQQHAQISKERAKVIRQYFPNKLKLHYSYYPSKLKKNFSLAKKKMNSLIKKIKNIIIDG
ncbi:MAG: glycosyltransferase family 2 protein [Nonlabens sp.]|uniref:glycosyltransferase family 2 protein n=1 Tax=Nonlabens sp. TaxID=1888209 RepID=UPI003EF59C27